MPKHTMSAPALHDVVRAIGYQAAQAGARSVAISRLRSGNWTVVSTLWHSAAPTLPEALTLTSDDTARLVAEARARRGQTVDIVDSDQLALAQIVRAGGEALERAGQDTFLLIADQNGLVGTNSEGDLRPIHVSSDQVARIEGQHRRARESQTVDPRPGQRVWYLPRGAPQPTAVVVERLGARRITIRLPSGEIVPVRRRRLLAMDAEVTTNQAAEPSPDPSEVARYAEPPSIHIEALTASMAHGLGLADTEVDLHERIRDLITWLFAADSDQRGPLEPNADAWPRQTLTRLLAAASSPDAVERALLLLRPELHHLARAGFQPAVQPAIESISAMDSRLDLLLTWVISSRPGIQARQGERETAESQPLGSDPFGSSLDAELATLREIATHLEAASVARRRLFGQRQLSSTPDES